MTFTSERHLLDYLGEEAPQLSFMCPCGDRIDPKKLVQAWGPSRQSQSEILCRQREGSSRKEVGKVVVLVIVMAVVMMVLGAMMLHEGKFFTDSRQVVSNALRHWTEAEGTTSAGTRRLGAWMTRPSYCVA